MSYVHIFNKNFLGILSTIQRTVDTVSFLANFFYFNFLIFQLRLISKHFYISLSVQLAFAFTHFYPQILNYFTVLGLCHVSTLLFPKELQNASSLQISTVMNLNLLKSASHPLPDIEYIK